MLIVNAGRYPEKADFLYKNKFASKEMGNSKTEKTYESEALHVLAYEFRESEISESNMKIKDRLRRKKLGDFDDIRINRLRKFKDEVRREISKSSRSEFWKHAKGRYADLSDWDIPRLTERFKTIFPDIPENEIANFVKYGIYLYYMR